MAFIEHDALSDLNESRYDWTICVRAQSIWEGINNKKKEFRGINIIFVDDSNYRIHAFIAPALSEKFKSDLKEGLIYEISNFSVKQYRGDEASRAVKNVKHVYFNNDTTCKKSPGTSLTIQPLSFDFHCLDDIERLKNDNRFLIDVVGVIDGKPTKSEYKKDDVDGSIVKFGLTDGKTYAIVTFFNEFGDSLLQSLEKKLEEPVIIIIASAHISVYNEEVGLTNYPATRFYLNCQHHSVNNIRKSLSEFNFYVSHCIEEEEKECPNFTVKEICSLKDEYIQRNVCVKMTVQKIDKTMNWFCNYCISCDVDLEKVGNRFKCPKCGKFKPYPDRRYEFSMLCSDKTGTIPVLWSSEELTRFTGKTVYDILADETQVGDGNNFPPILQQFEKKSYAFTLSISKENVLQGSNLYTAVKVSDPAGMWEPLETTKKINPPVQQTEISQDITMVKSNSPPTGESTNKTRSRKTTDPVEMELPQKTTQRKAKHVKIEKKSE